MLFVQLEGARAWGSQGAALSKLDGPMGVVTMSTGRVWVVDHDKHWLCLFH
jgi:hypothetical protein